MTETKDNSSLPLLLSITGAVLVVAVGGWFLLEQEDSVPPVARDPLIATPLVDTTTSPDVTPPDNPAPTVEDEPKSVSSTVPVTEAFSDIDGELRKARLAADVDILVFPPEQSALHYYGRVLEADPNHAVAAAELDTILTRVAQIVTQHLEQQEFDAAYQIAVLVAKQRPEHALVASTQQALDDYTEQLVAEALQHVRVGDDDQADQKLATAADLPGRNPDYFTAIRDSITEIRDARQAAQRDRAQRARVANNDARASWVQRIRTAIAQGNLISPAGASARDLLAERNAWSAERSQLNSELLSAMLNSIRSHIDASRFNDAEVLLNAAAALGADAKAIEELGGSLEGALIDAKSNRMVPMSALVQLKSVAPRYPRRASRLNQSGWVDVVFTVTPGGTTEDIAVQNAEPESVFDDAAVDAVAEWEFQPVEYRGQAISQRAGARLVFRIE